MAGRRLAYELEATDDVELVATGQHERVVINLAVRGQGSREASKDRGSRPVVSFDVLDEVFLGPLAQAPGRNAGGTAFQETALPTSRAETSKACLRGARAAAGGGSGSNWRSFRTTAGPKNPPPDSDLRVREP